MAEHQSLDIKSLSLDSKKSTELDLNGLNNNLVQSEGVSEKLSVGSRGTDVVSKTGVSWASSSSIIKEKDSKLENIVTNTSSVFPNSKSVTFELINDLPQENEIENSYSVPSFVSRLSNTDFTRSISNPLANVSSFTDSSRKNYVLENIPEVDENISDIDETPGYYGWDGYEAKFKDITTDNVSQSSIPNCIPPWAKSLRKSYGLPETHEDKKEELGKNMKEKIEQLMKKHKELMLLKRVESKKQVIVEPGKYYDDLNAVKMRSKSTRYYMTPLSFDEDKSAESYVQRGSQDVSYDKVSLPSFSGTDSMSITKKTSRPQTRREISEKLRSLAKKTKKNLDNEQQAVQNQQSKCPKITLSKIREFVNMDPDEKKLHEIIRIEKVPSHQDLKNRGKPTSKYIVNVPHSGYTDQATVNTIKIKEKRKLRVDSIENIEEKITELRYKQGKLSKLDGKESESIQREGPINEADGYIKKKVKSPTETKTLQITSKQTPLIGPVIDEKNKKTDRVLLIQYDKNTKSRKSNEGKHTTQLLGIHQPCLQNEGEIYLYGSQSDGKQVEENVTKVDCVSPSIKDKVYSIFEELKGLTAKQKILPGIASSTIPTLKDESTQRPSNFFGTTDIAMVQAVPEVKSAEVQVHLSQLSLSTDVQSGPSVMAVPHPTPTSEFIAEANEPEAIIDENLLQNKLDRLAPEESVLKEPPTPKVDASKDDLFMEELPLDIDLNNRSDEFETHVQEDSTKVKEIVYDKDEEDKKENEVEREEDILESKEDVTGITKEDIIETQEDVVETKDDIESRDGKQEAELITKLTNLEGEDTSIPEPIKKKEKTTEKLAEEKKGIEPEEPEIRTQSKISQKEQEKFKIQAETSSTKFFEELSQKDTDDLKYIASPHLSLSVSSNKEKLSLSQGSAFLTGSLEQEDIRSYELEPHLGDEPLFDVSPKEVSTASLGAKSSSKFLHRKEDLRKRLNWTDDTIYLENRTCPTLIKGLAETALRQPADPIAFLAHWILKDYENREATELEEVQKEHLEVVRATKEITKENQVLRKFNFKKYPVQELIPTDSEKVGSNSGSATKVETSVNEIMSNEVQQEA